MLSFKRSSVLKKILLSTIPILAGALFVSAFIERNASEHDERLQKAVDMTSHADQAELEMVKMSEALRGYLLAPKNKNEFKRKKEADAAYAAHAEEISKLCQDDPDISELNSKMAKYDAEDLDRIENEVAALIEKNDPKSFEFYLKTYAPAREIQAANFMKLKDLVYKKSARIIKEMHAKKVANARMTIVLLMLSIFSGLAVMIWVTKSLVNTINEISLSISNEVTDVDGVASDLASSSQRLSESATQQASSLQETAASLEQITAMVAKASENAKQSAESSSLTQEKARSGQQSVDEMLEAVDEIRRGNLDIMEQVKRSNDQMGQVINIIKEIGNKTEVINEIVFQTKLLSFNASVEAARAGEQGKGFAVVASEVGSLAQMSGNAAKEISDMLVVSIGKVEEIVKESKARVQNLVDVNKSKFERSTEVAKQCSARLSEIVTNVDHMTGLAQEISSATHEQSQGLAEISKAMSQLDSATQINSSASEESAGSSVVLSEKTVSLRQSVNVLVQTILGESAETTSNIAGHQKFKPSAFVNKKHIKPSDGFGDQEGEFAA